ncbi:hypothetical protein NDU88_011537 [Pleurodeles waltl]|uniref:Ferredoxin n=1 Tax=Pleurodeles waltl TaxID=8319 RepID=A0AAV7S1G4_PLEWA|nr:hypothetical protein NDU88_011537 [Pleurodeles waltl]
MHCSIEAKSEEVKCSETGCIEVCITAFEDERGPGGIFDPLRFVISRNKGQERAGQAVEEAGVDPSKNVTADGSAGPNPTKVEVEKK